MTALAQDRITNQYGTPDSVEPLLLSFPVAAATTIYGGSLVATNAAGYAVPASASNALKIWGRCEKQVVNTTAAGYGSNGDLQVSVKPGAFYFGNSASTDAITLANVGSLCYVVDDQTVALTSNGGLRPAAGVIYNVDASGNVGVLVGHPSLYSDSAVAEPVSLLRAKNVINGNIADLTAYTVAANASRNDNVANVEGDIVLLINQTTASQNGLYVVGVVAAGTAPLTRSPSMPSGLIVSANQFEVSVLSGDVFAQSKFFNTAAVTIGTTDPAFYPERVTITQALVAGTMTLTSVPILSATKTGFAITRSTANTSTATTGGYALSGNPTPGILGTASATIFATVAAGTINNADISTLHITIINR